ncbi:endonuclease domain-containing protein [Streptomyces canus]|uniref:endonuclease domain-containing protein n=1 Tax=Streptomyces canus TaxID=58343 RepID=UPI0036C127D4
MTTKTCSHCGEEKPVERFPLRADQADGLHFWCMSCKREKDRAYSARYRAADPERKRASAIAYQRRNRQTVSEAARRYKYGLSSAEIAALIEAQGGGCALCRLPLGDSFHVDHDHACCPGSKTCGECIRGVLCRRCNIGLGQFNDDPDLLAAAAAYSLSLRNVLPPVGQPN